MTLTTAFFGCLNPFFFFLFFDETGMSSHYFLFVSFCGSLDPYVWKFTYEENCYCEKKSKQAKSKTEKETQGEKSSKILLSNP